MKILSSSSSSTSSTSDTSSCTHKNVVSGGVVGMLRRLLCFKNLPTYCPFDRNTEYSNEATQYGELDHGKQEEHHIGNLGVVARLMGLDSLPDVGLDDDTQMRPNLITRSRSMNYADTLREEMVEGKHCRIKSTLSFRDAPPFVEIETEEFFILSFEGGGKDNELELKTRKCDKGHGELRQRRREKSRDMNKRKENGYEGDKENSVPKMMVLNDVNVSKNEGLSKILLPTSKSNINSDFGREVLRQAKPIRQKQSGERRQSRRKKKEKCSSPVQKVEIQSDSENSSPVSVLDFGDSPLKPEVLDSEEDLRLSNLNSRRRLSGELEIYTHSSSSTTTSNSTNNDGKADKIEAKRLQSWKKDREFQNYAEMWEEISKLTKFETMELNRMYRETMQVEDFKDIGSAIGIEILDQLIFEFLELLTSKQDNFDF